MFARSPFDLMIKLVYNGDYGQDKWSHYRCYNAVCVHFK